MDFCIALITGGGHGCAAKPLKAMSKERWITAYQARPVESLGWYAASLPTSHRLVRAYLKCALRDAAVIDVGAGASVFADQMIADECLDITLLDLSAEALSVTFNRLNENEALTLIADNLLTCPALRPAGPSLWGRADF